MRNKILSIAFILFSFIYTSINLVYPQSNEYTASPSVVNLVNKGIELHKSQDFFGAIKAFQEASSIEPANKIVKQNLSIAHNNYGKYLAERTDYDKALKEFRLAIYFYKENKTALTNLDALLNQRGVKADDPMVRKSLGDKLRQDADFECALVEYEIAKNLSKTPNQDILLAVGDINYILYLREGQKTDNIQKALDSYNAALIIKETAKAHIKVGDALLGQRDVVGAIEHYKKALDLEPTNIDVLTSNIRGWNEAIRLAPLVAENHIGLAQALQLKKDFPMAEEEYKQALKLDPNNPAALNGLKSLDQDKHLAEAAGFLQEALKLQSESKYDEAIQSYVKAVEVNPNDTNIHYNIGTAFQAKNDFDHAEKAYKKALEINPTNEKAKLAYDSLKTEQTNKKVSELTKRAIELQTSGTFDEAIKTYEAAIALSPQDSKLYYNLGTAYQSKGDLEGAKTQYIKAQSLDKNNKSYSDAISTANFELAKPLIVSALKKQSAEDIQGAISDYLKALEYTPNDAQTHFNLATAYQASEQFDKALASYKKASELDSKGQADAFFFLATIYEQKKDFKSATFSYQKYLQNSPQGNYVQDAKDRINYLKTISKN